MKVEHKELLYYRLIAAVVLTVSVADFFGAGLCAFLPLMFVVYRATLKFIPKEKEPGR